MLLESKAQTMREAHTKKENHITTRNATYGKQSGVHRYIGRSIDRSYNMII